MTPQPFTKWHFDRLSPEQMEEIIELHSRKSWIRINAIYKAAGVQPDPTCNSCSLDMVILWTNYAIKNNLIYEPE